MRSCRARRIAANVQRWTLNVQRTILKMFYGNLDEAVTREALCVTCISELDVERWMLNVGRLQIRYRFRLRA